MRSTVRTAEGPFHSEKVPDPAFDRCSFSIYRKRGMEISPGPAMEEGFNALEVQPSFIGEDKIVAQVIGEPVEYPENLVFRPGGLKCGEIVCGLPSRAANRMNGRQKEADCGSCRRIQRAFLTPRVLKGWRLLPFVPERPRRDARTAKRPDKPPVRRRGDG